MKRIVLTFVIACCSIMTWAQSEHLTFKGVPIDGTLTEFVTKMKTAGFTHLGTQDGMAALQGDFAGYKNCMVGVYTIKPLNVVSMIGVMFNVRETWSDLEGDYDFFKAMLTEKYGEPAVVVEEFERPTRDNNAKIYELRMDRCTWASAFHTDKGEIELSIEYNNFECRVILRYRDKINTERVKKQAMEDL